MNDRAALPIVLLLSCVFALNAQLFFSSFPSTSYLKFSEPVLAEVLPERTLREEQVLAPPAPASVLQNISARSYYVSHEAPNARLLLQYEPYEVYSLASLTKLATALTLLEYEIDWQNEVVIVPSDIRGGAKTLIRPGYKVSVGDLWAMMLIASDNDATAALVRFVSGDEAQFVRRMNEMATQMSLQQTNFVEPTGLSAGNVSTAREFALIARAVFREDKIKDTLSQAAMMVNLPGGEKRILSTDQLIRYSSNENWTYQSAKTGFTYIAGYTSAVLGIDKLDRETVVVTLGSQSNNDRSTDISRLMDWASSQAR